MLKLLDSVHREEKIIGLRETFGEQLGVKKDFSEFKGEETI